LGARSSTPAALDDPGPLALGAPVALAWEPPRPQALISSNKQQNRLTGPDHRAFGPIEQAFARMLAVPRFTPAELLPLLDCEPSEISARAQALAGRSSARLCQRILELRELARRTEPKPTSEELCLGLLSLLALDEAGR